MLGIKEDFKAVVFTLGRESYALPIHHIQEIIRMPKVTTLPNRAPYFLGIANLRGRIVPILDLGLKLLGKPCSVDDDTRVIVIEYGIAALGVTVDAVKEVVTISRDCLVETPKIQDGPEEQLLGIARFPDRLIMLLDMEKALSV